MSEVNGIELCVRMDRLAQWPRPPAEWLAASPTRSALPLSSVLVESLLNGHSISFDQIALAWNSDATGEAIPGGIAFGMVFPVDIARDVSSASFAETPPFLRWTLLRVAVEFRIGVRSVRVPPMALSLEATVGRDAMLLGIWRFERVEAKLSSPPGVRLPEVTTVREWLARWFSLVLSPMLAEPDQSAFAVARSIVGLGTTLADVRWDVLPGNPARRTVDALFVSYQAASNLWEPGLRAMRAGESDSDYAARIAAIRVPLESPIVSDFVGLGYVRVAPPLMYFFLQSALRSTLGVPRWAYPAVALDRAEYFVGPRESRYSRRFGRDVELYYRTVRALVSSARAELADHGVDVDLRLKILSVSHVHREPVPIEATPPQVWATTEETEDYLRRRPELQHVTNMLASTLLEVTVFLEGNLRPTRRPTTDIAFDDRVVWQEFEVWVDLGPLGWAIVALGFVAVVLGGSLAAAGVIAAKVGLGIVITGFIAALLLPLALTFFRLGGGDWLDREVGGYIRPVDAGLVNSLLRKLEADRGDGDSRSTRLPGIPRELARRIVGAEINHGGLYFYLGDADVSPLLHDLSFSARDLMLRPLEGVSLATGELYSPVRVDSGWAPDPRADVWYELIEDNGMQLMATRVRAFPGSRMLRYGPAIPAWIHREWGSIGVRNIVETLARVVVPADSVEPVTGVRTLDEQGDPTLSSLVIFSKPSMSADGAVMLASKMICWEQAQRPDDLTEAQRARFGDRVPEGLLRCLRLRLESTTQGALEPRLLLGAPQFLDGQVRWVVTYEDPAWSTLLDAEWVLRLGGRLSVPIQLPRDLRTRLVPGSRELRYQRSGFRALTLSLPRGAPGVVCSVEVMASTRVDPVRGTVVERRATELLLLNPTPAP